MIPQLVWPLLLPPWRKRCAAADAKTVNP